MQATLRCVARWLALVLLPLVLASRAPASEWVVRDGVCTEQWTGGDLLRGPSAIVSGALLPVRSLAGGFVYAGSSSLRQPSSTYMAPLWIVGSTLFGVAEGVWWIGSGALDTVSGGALLLSPDDATGFRLDPIVPFIDDTGYGDHCRASPAPERKPAQASPVAIGTSSASPHSAHDPS